MLLLVLLFVCRHAAMKLLLQEKEAENLRLLTAAASATAPVASQSPAQQALGMLLDLGEESNGAVTTVDVVEMFLVILINTYLAQVLGVLLQPQQHVESQGRMCPTLALRPVATPPVSARQPNRSS